MVLIQLMSVKMAGNLILSTRKRKTSSVAKSNANAVFDKVHRARFYFRFAGISEGLRMNPSI